MARIATTEDSTIWKCDRCGKMVTTVDAFHEPDAWWIIAIQRVMGERYMKRQIRTADYCSKDCVMMGIRYSTYGGEREVVIGDRRTAAWPAMVTG